MKVPAPSLNELALRIVASKAKREAKQPDVRSAEALELIADSLVAILEEMKSQSR